MSSSPGPGSSAGGGPNPAVPRGISELGRGSLPIPPELAKAPRDAATVILLRPAGAGYEVYLVKRAQAIAFMGGAHVFPGGRVDPKTDPNVEAAAVREVEEECAVKLDVRALRLWARWVTPEVEPKRFDARFFVAAVPAGQAAACDQGECVEGEWLSPRAALEAAEKGAIALPPPTLWNLLDLAALPTIDAVL
ncbi:MAG TPA: NUDIX hydrolase, partial [Planctomycetota bacterium]|nr:NUDIX hydrolase [Planctomycetota bacterium]